MNRKTEITIETHSITIIRAKSGRFSEHCEHCGETVSAFTPEQTAIFMRLDAAEVYRRVEAGELHLIKNGRAVALVCGNSGKNSI